MSPGYTNVRPSIAENLFWGSKPGFGPICAKWPKSALFADSSFFTLFRGLRGAPRAPIKCPVLKSGYPHGCPRAVLKTGHFVGVPRPP